MNNSRFVYVTVIICIYLVDSKTVNKVNRDKKTETNDHRSIKDVLEELLAELEYQRQTYGNTGSKGTANSNEKNLQNLVHGEYETINYEAEKKQENYVVFDHGKAKTLEEKNALLIVNEDSDKRLLPKTDNEENAKRNFRYEWNWKWPDGIVYYEIPASSQFSQSSVEKILWAMSEIERFTCIQWKPSNERFRVVFTNDQSEGCQSYIGNIQSRTNSSYQIINLKEKACIQNATILHEICHSLGMEHEHSRSDRDKYLSVLWENVEQGKSNVNMKKLPTENLKTPFDYFSVTMYSVYSNSRQWDKKTMKLVSPYLDFLTESDHGLSFYDVMLLNRAYQCSDHCDPDDLRNCKNGGFMMKGCKCLCPDGLQGDLCEQVKTDTSCGGIIDIHNINDEANVTSPNFPQKYPLGVYCRWLVRGPTGSKLAISFDGFDVNGDDDKCYHTLELRFNLIGQIGPRWNSNGVTSQRYSQRGHFCLHFNSNFLNLKENGSGYSVFLCCDTINFPLHKEQEAGNLFCGSGINKNFTTLEYGYANLLLLSFDSATYNNHPAGNGFSVKIKAISGNMATQLVDACNSAPCQNGGSCVNYGVYDFICRCSDGFEGKNCETSNRSRSDSESSNPSSSANYVFRCDNGQQTDCQKLKVVQGVQYTTDASTGDMTVNAESSYTILEVDMFLYNEEEFCVSLDWKACGIFELQRHIRFEFFDFQYDDKMLRAKVDGDACQTWNVRSLLSFYVQQGQEEKVRIKILGTLSLRNIRIFKGTTCY